MKAILTVSFGTSYNDSREITIGAIERAIQKAFPEYEVRRAFTSGIIIDKLKARDNIRIDDVKEALERAAADGVTTLVVQPTHLMSGYEYAQLADTVKKYQNNFEQAVLAEPLLTHGEDFNGVIRAITERTASYDDGETAIYFMGHGTEADANAVYAKMQDKLTDMGYENYYIGTVEASPSLEDVLTEINRKGIYKRVVLMPLMVVSGDHANHDMAGDEEDSWKRVIAKAGYQVECIMEGLGQLSAVRDIYIAHTRAAMERLKA